METSELEKDVHHRIRRMAIALYGFGITFIIIVALFLTWEINLSDEFDTYDPLGEYPVQIVTAEEILDNGTKAVFLEGDIEVEGTKCNDSSKDVQVVGFITWHAVDPPGTIVDTGVGRNEMEPGCTTTVFQNQIPVEVRIAIQAQHDNGIHEPVWHIQGTEWPLDEDGERGEPRRYETENFIVLEEDDRP